jgi:hypothetical protein
MKAGVVDPVADEPNVATQLSAGRRGNPYSATGSYGDIPRLVAWPMLTAHTSR